MESSEFTTKAGSTSNRVADSGSISKRGTPCENSLPHAKIQQVLGSLGRPESVREPQNERESVFAGECFDRVYSLFCVFLFFAPDLRRSDA